MVRRGLGQMPDGRCLVENGSFKRQRQRQAQLFIREAGRDELARLRRVRVGGGE